MLRAVARDGVASAAELAAHGATASQLSRAAAAGQVVRLRRGVYGLAPLPALPRHLVTERGPAPEYRAHVRAAQLAAPGTAAAGRTAAVLHGWGLLVEPRRTLELAAGHGTRPDPPGLRVRRCRRPSFVLLPDGLRVSDPVSTVVDCALQLSLLEAVVVADSALRAGATDLVALQRATRDLSGRREAARVRRVLAHCDPQCGSVLETVLRVRLVQAGLSGFRSQAALHSPGEPVLRVDFAFDDARLVVEVDGARWHTDPDRDRRRDNRLARDGWRVLRYTWSDVVHEPERVLAEIARALASPVVHLAANPSTAAASRAA